jgi:hypothetical protein
MRFDVMALIVVAGVSVAVCAQARALYISPDEAATTIEGFRLVDQKWAASIPTHDDSGPTLPVVLQQNIPEIISPFTKATKAFNDGMSAFARSIWSNAGAPRRADRLEDTGEDFQLDYAPNHDALPGVLSISMTMNSSSHDAPRGSSDAFDFNWNIAARRSVRPEDIFDANVDWQQGVGNAAIAAFERAGVLDNNYFMYDYGRAALIENLANPIRWVVLKSGLRIDASQGEICPFMCGMPTATIPWSELKAYLKPGGLVRKD